MTLNEIIQKKRKWAPIILEIILKRKESHSIWVTLVLIFSNGI